MQEFLLSVTVLSIYCLMWVILTSSNYKKVGKVFIFTASLLVATSAWPSIENIVSLAYSRWNTWTIVREAQPEWHVSQKRIIEHYAKMIANDYRSQTVCKYWDPIGTWHYHRERVRIHNHYVIRYTRAVMRDSQGSQYQGIEKVLPRELSPCPAPVQPSRF